MEEIFICSKSFFNQNKARITKLGVTHVVIEKKTLDSNSLHRFNFLQINSLKNNQQNNFFDIPSKFAPIVLDYLREAFLFRGKAIFVEEDNSAHTNSSSKMFIRTLLIYCLSYFFKCSLYETLMLINSQVKSPKTNKNFQKKFFC